jgi:hypothetical protein
VSCYRRAFSITYEIPIPRQMGIFDTEISERNVLVCFGKFKTNYLCLFLARQSLAVQDRLIFEVSPSHSDTPSSAGIRPSQRRIIDNTQHSQETGVHVVGGIRNRNSSQWEAADPHLTLCDHCDNHFRCLTAVNFIEIDQHSQYLNCKSFVCV